MIKTDLHSFTIEFDFPNNRTPDGFNAETVKQILVDALDNDQICSKANVLFVEYYLLKGVEKD